MLTKTSLKKAEDGGKNLHHPLGGLKKTLSWQGES